MQFKKIDCKMKEIYFNNEIVEEKDSKEEESRMLFWNTLDIMALQNRTLQHIKFA